MFEEIASDGVQLLALVFWTVIAMLVISGLLWAFFPKKPK